ncbi:PEDO-1 family subclass B3 metallo-beta-lactamase [Pedobacter miscanthi]|uniref:Subclass B3 metallo-beta-lactamase n=1 Tax=Pedobacter miscanthi TaxID=2259170 RepID=A0A366KLJ0_9SPHI|nr:PEDO-1 family subclass B3 metallo-beta-lactamase [Pedobacter miscanthi]RBQ02546.1 subclass B3 metallo-beta-lactamase [Pedobacter miscanthi]
MKVNIIFFLLLFPFFVFSQNVREPADTPKEWSASYAPFRIVGNVYYVGTYDLACYLITTPKGNILINTGLASSATQIEKNVAALGFKFKDIKILLTTQAHYDHLGAMAEIKKLTGAKMMVDEKDAQVMKDGGRTDYALGGKESSYTPIVADRLLKDKDPIQLGGTSITMLHHPGHTKGSCSFLLKTKDEKRSYKVLIANMPSIVTDKKFSDIPAYPTISKDYAYSFSSLKKLSFDIWLSSHASQFNLHEKHKPGDAYNPAAFMDRKGYDETLKNLEATYLKKIAAE